MATYSPSFFLLSPGPWETPGELLSILAPIGRDVLRLPDLDANQEALAIDLVEDPTGFGAAMSMAAGTIEEADLQACTQTTRAALIRVPGRLDRSNKLAAMIGQLLLQNGGLAIRHEASAKAHSLEPWIHLMETGQPISLLSAAVTYAYDDRGYFSTGMQQFDRPDVEVLDADHSEAGQWLQSFCAFTIADEPVLASGHTFSPDAETPRRKIERWPDSRHHPDDGRHNPFGLWRALPVGSVGLDALDPEPVCIPALTTLLHARQRQVGRPLSRDEIDQAVAQAAAISMSVADVRELERGRGYADIEGRRAWEQWQAISAQ